MNWPFRGKSSSNLQQDQCSKHAVSEPHSGLMLRRFTSTLTPSKWHLQGQGEIQSLSLSAPCFPLPRRFPSKDLQRCRARASSWYSTVCSTKEPCCLAVRHSSIFFFSVSLICQIVQLLLHPLHLQSFPPQAAGSSCLCQPLHSLGLFEPQGTEVS